MENMQSQFNLLAATMAANSEEQFRVLNEAIAAAQQPPVVDNTPQHTAQTEALPPQIKVKVPKDFDGNRARVPYFTHEVENYMKLMRLQTSIMSLVPTLLTGVAASWWHSLLSAGTAPDAWEVFKPELVRRFGDPKLGENMREELAALKSGRAAEVVRGELERIFAHLPGLPEMERIWHFKSKLKGTTRYVLEQHDPQTLIAAYEMAETVERAALVSQGINFTTPGSGRVSRFMLHRPRSTPWSGGRDQGPVPMELGAMNGKRQARAPLTEREKSELFKSNGCFYCRVPNAGHLSRDCPQRGPRPRPGNGRGRASS